MKHLACISTQVSCLGMSLLVGAGLADKSLLFGTAKPARRILALLAVLFMMPLIPSTSLQAHGLGRQQLERAEAGPFLVTAWTDPDPARAGSELHITIGVEYENGLLLDAQVTVTAVHTNDTDLRESSRATHDNAINKLQYEAPLRLEKGGVWQLTIAVYDEQGEGDVSFNLDVESDPSNDLPWTWIGAGIFGISLVGLAAINRLRLNREQKKVQT